MLQLIARSTRLVVMTERGRTILQEVYDAPPAKIDLIPHGIPDVTFVARIITRTSSAWAERRCC